MSDLIKEKVALKIISITTEMKKKVGTEKATTFIKLMSEALEDAYLDIENLKRQIK